MKLRNIGLVLMACWAATYFVASLLLIVLPCYIISFFSDPLRSKLSFSIFRPWLTSFFIFTGVKRKITGTEYFSGKENFVVVCNHRSFVDVLMCSPGIPGLNKTIAKAEMARIPIFGVIYRLGSVLIDRKNARSRQASYVQMKHVLESGMHMCIYPEGTRNTTLEPLLRFQDGAFRLACDMQKRIIPTVLLHTDRVIPPGGKFHFNPQPVSMHFLPPVEVKGKDYEMVKNEVHELMTQYYMQHTSTSNRKESVSKLSI